MRRLFLVMAGSLVAAVVFAPAPRPRHQARTDRPDRGSATSSARSCGPGQGPSRSTAMGSASTSRGASHCGHQPGAAQHVRPSRRAVALADRPSGGYAHGVEIVEIEGRRQGPGAAAAGQRPTTLIVLVRDLDSVFGRLKQLGARSSRRAARPLFVPSGAQVARGHREGSRRALRRAVSAGSAAGGPGHSGAERDRGARAPGGHRRRAGDASLSRCARPGGARARRVCRATRPCST